MVIPAGKAISRPAIGKLIKEYESADDSDTSDALKALCNGVKMIIDSLPKVDMDDDIEIVNAEYAKCLRAFGEALVKKAA